MNTTQDFDAAFAAFMDGARRRVRPEVVRLETDIGPRYIRVVCVEHCNGEDRRTLYRFVDRTTGEVLVGSWKQPRHTKQQRWNIFDANNGLISPRP
jgi:hypothetical protein